MRPHNLDFRSSAVSASACLSEAWQLIRDHYWLFLGIVLFAELLAAVAPLGILAGPALCGIHICLLRRERRQQLEFSHMFDGFNFFVPSLIATLIIIVPEGILFFLIYILVYVLGIGALIAFAGNQPNAGPAPVQPEIGIGMLIGGGILMPLLIIAAIIVQALVLFTYPLIVDKELSGWDAIKLSCRAVLANKGGIARLMLLRIVLGIAVSLLLCVGPILFMPLDIAMVMAAYRHVFTDDTDRFGEYERFPEDDEPLALPVPSEGITDHPKSHSRSDSTENKRAES